MAQSKLLTLCGGTRIYLQHDGSKTTSPSSPPIYSLPNELLDQIFSFVWETPYELICKAQTDENAYEFDISALLISHRIYPFSLKALYNTTTIRIHNLHDQSSNVAMLRDRLQYIQNIEIDNPSKTWADIVEATKYVIAQYPHVRRLTFGYHARVSEKRTLRQDLARKEEMDELRIVEVGLWRISLTFLHANSSTNLHAPAVYLKHKGLHRAWASIKREGLPGLLYLDNYLNAPDAQYLAGGRTQFRLNRWLMMYHYLITHRRGPCAGGMECTIPVLGVQLDTCHMEVVEEAWGRYAGKVGLLPPKGSEERFKCKERLLEISVEKYGEQVVEWWTELLARMGLRFVRLWEVGEEDDDDEVNDGGSVSTVGG